MKFKFGTQHEQEVICRAVHDGWDRAHIGGHIVRYNEIFECEQAGIVGHLGAVFSEIYGNRIHHIHHKRLFHGAEVSGIKLHASLDTQIHDNVIYSCYRGVWFDWQAQGTHLFRNVLFDNLSEDLFVEVCHGPYMLDHNLFLSKMNFRNVSQGGAFVHNLFTGRFVINPDRGRQTPYHFPHETAVAGYANIIGGDDRYYNNIFLRDNDPDDTPIPIGFFDHLPLKPRTQEEQEAEKKAKLDGLPSKNNATLYPVGLGSYNTYPGPYERFWEKPFNPGIREIHLPCAISGNLYLKNALPSTIDHNACVKAESGIAIDVDTTAATVHLYIQPSVLRGGTHMLIHSTLLGKTYHAEMRFENPDGSDYCFDRDFFGTLRTQQNITPGPFVLQGDAPIDICL